MIKAVFTYFFATKHLCAKTNVSLRDLFINFISIFFYINAFYYPNKNP